MRTIAILNQKGGVGKTTTAVNLAAALARDGLHVGVIDLDPQAHASTHLGLPADGQVPSMYDVLVGEAALGDARRNVSERLWAAGSVIDLAAAEVELAGRNGRESILKQKLAAEYAHMNEAGEPLDAVFMDCGPSLGVLTLNALAAADEVLIPLQPHFFALHGLGKLLETTALVTRRINPRLKVLGVLMCMAENTKLSAEVRRDLTDFFANAKGTNTPWRDAKLFETHIRRNVKLAECPSHGRTIFEYAPNSNGATDYAGLARELCGVPELAGV